MTNNVKFLLSYSTFNLTPDFERLSNPAQEAPLANAPLKNDDATLRQALMKSPHWLQE